MLTDLNALILLLVLILYGAILLVWPVPAVADDDPIGITVGAPKIFDNRSLEIMLEDLAAQLRQLRTIDGAPLGEAAGKIQGSRITSVERSLEAKQTPLPAISELVREPDEEDVLQPTSEKTSRGEVAFTPPALPAAAALSTPVTDYGLAPQDLLADQVSLQYQIYNLRMLLQRSVSDRFYDGGGDAKGSRLQVVLGFQISIDPHRAHRGRAAVVEIEVAPADDSKRRPSLVALMPLEKTYNATALSQKSNAFGGAALASVFSIGYSERRRGQTFYLYRDADTFAFERPLEAADSKSLTFGWQFQPVLDRPSIGPGIRQLFAVLALDEEDARPDGGAAALELKVTARTHWIKYDPKRRTTKGKPDTTVPAYADRTLSVPYSSTLQESLAPTVTSAEAVPLDDDSVLIKITGKNFDRDTSVTIGERTIAPGSSSFVVRSSNRLQLVTKVKEILEGETALTGGRYGFPTLVEDPKASDETTTGSKATGFEVAAVSRGARSGDGHVVLEIELEHPKSCEKQLPELFGRRVYVTIGDRVFDLPAQRWKEVPEDGKPSTRRVGSLSVPVELMKEDQLVSVAIPFLGEKYRGSALLVQPARVEKVIMLDSGDPMVWGLVGHGLHRPIAERARVFADREHAFGDGVNYPDPSKEDPHLLQLEAPKGVLKDVKHVTVILPGLYEPTRLPAPTVPAPKKKPAVSGPQQVAKNSAGVVTFAGTDLKAVAKVVFEDKELVHRATSDTALEVFLTRTVTKETGDVTLLGYSDAGALVPLTLTVR